MNRHQYQSQLRRPLACATVTTTLALCAGSANAQPASEVTGLRKQLEDSQRIIKELAGRLDSLEVRVESAPPPASDRITARLDELEDVVLNLDDRVGSRAVVHAFDAMQLDIGGFITQSFVAAFGGGESTASFAQTQFELLLKAQVNEDWEVFLAQGFLREADLDVSDPDDPRFEPSALRIPQIIAWTNYRLSDQFEVQAGRFITPHGIINIEHFPPVLLDINQPQFLRPFSGATIFPNFLIGAQIHGKFNLGPNENSLLQYNVYAGSFSANSSDFILGGRLGLRLGDSGFTFGGNYSHGQRRAGTPGVGNFSLVGNNSVVSNSYNTVGADLLYDKGRILWKNEIFYSYEDGQDNRLAFYTQPAYRINGKWLAFYRYDYLDPGQGQSYTTEHVVGLNYLPIPTVRLRAVGLLKHIDDPSDDVLALQFSATVSF